MDLARWSAELEGAWSLDSPEHFRRFSHLMDSLTGEESESYAEKLINSIRVPEDLGAYESLYNALWRFPPESIAALLAQNLPSLQRRMGKYDQVSRFLIPIASSAPLREVFWAKARDYTPSERRTVKNAVQEWSREDPVWEALGEGLGVQSLAPPEETPPPSWPPLWQKRLAKALKEGGEYCVSGLFWKGTLKRWIEDLDFLLAVLSLDLGPHWRQVDPMTNPLWFYSRSTVYPLFLEKLRQLPREQQQKILASVSRANKSKGARLQADLKQLTQKSAL